MTCQRLGLGFRLFVLSTVLLIVASSGCALDEVSPGEPGRTEATATEPSATDTPTQSSTRSPAEEVPDWLIYINQPYGFSLRYPSAWQLIEGQNFVSLNQGSVNLVVGYRHVTEDPNICCRQRLPEGELVQSGSVTCQGEEIEKSLLRCEGETKAVIYQGTEEVAVGDLRFLFYLEDFNADYQAAGIPEDVQMEVDRVVSSLETFQPASDFATATPRPTKLPPTPESSPQPTASPTAAPATVTPVPAMAAAQPDGANVRSGPGTDYPLQGSLEGGERVEILGRYADWWQVAYRGRTAWIYDGVVTTSNAEAVPRVDIAPTRVPSSPTQIPTPAAPSAIQEPRWIDVDLAEQRLTAYENGQAVHTTLISTGLPRTPTVQGQFRIWIKLRADDMEGPDYYLEDVPYVMYFYQGYGLHGAPWHNNFGHRMSHGCVNLPVPEAEWLFNFADVGTLVNVRP